MSESDKKNNDKFGWLKNLSFFKKLKQVKHIGFIITVMFLIILLLILFGDFNFLGQGKSASASTNSVTTYSKSSEFVVDMESKLKSLISKIKGAGNVEVMITVDNGASVVLATNDQTVSSSSGGTSTTTVSASPIILDQNGSKTPIIIEEVLPTIKGVVVVSSGAKDVNVRLNILNAVQTLTGLDSGQIQILAGE